MNGSLVTLLIILAVIFCIGLVSGILSIFFTIKKIQPIAAIILSIVCWFGVSVMVNMTLGILIGSLLTIFLGMFSVIIIIKSVKIIKQNSK